MFFCHLFCISLSHINWVDLVFSTCGFNYSYVYVLLKLSICGPLSLSLSLTGDMNFIHLMMKWWGVKLNKNSHFLWLLGKRRVWWLGHENSHSWEWNIWFLFIWNIQYMHIFNYINICKLVKWRGNIINIILYLYYWGAAWGGPRIVLSVLQYVYLFIYLLWTSTVLPSFCRKSSVLSFVQ